MSFQAITALYTINIILNKWKVFTTHLPGCAYNSKPSTCTIIDGLRIQIYHYIAVMHIGINELKVFIRTNHCRMVGIPRFLRPLRSPGTPRRFWEFPEILIA